MVFVSRTVVSSSTLNVAVPSLAGDQPASEEDLVVVTTPRLLQHAHQDQDSAAHQQDQVASTEADSVADSRAAVEEEDSEEDLMAHAVVVEETSKAVAAGSAVDMEAADVAASATSRMALAELLTVHQQVLVADVVEDLAEEDSVIAHNSKNASVVPAEATVNQSDHEAVDIATAMDLEVVPEAEMVVDAMTLPENAHTTETDTMAAETSEGTNVVDATTPIAPWASMDWHSRCALRFPLPYHDIGILGVPGLALRLHALFDLDRSFSLIF
jgi:hypothetical protein